MSSSQKTFQLQNAYDSHVHFFATGELALIPQLKILRSTEDLNQIVFPSEQRKNGWVYGFGWNDTQWTNLEGLHRSTIDPLFPNEPVLLSRIDGHSSWCNTKALVDLGYMDTTTKKQTALAQELNQQYSMIEVDAAGVPTGILRETAHILALQKMGDWSTTQKKAMFLRANQIFLEQGYTHVRDMTTTMEQYQFLKNLEDQKKLHINLDLNFVIEGQTHFHSLLKDLQNISDQDSRQLRVRGVKIFFDGSLGSQTAFISNAYPNGKQGVALWDLKDVEEVLIHAFKNQLEVAVHTIGDEAVDQILQVAQKVSQQGIFGRLNLEHLEFCRPQSIQRMKSLHVRCHMQPAYWLSDKSWLQTLHVTQKPYFFQWEALRAAKVDLQFGSDSPIESPSVQLIQQGLQDAAAYGIPRFRGDVLLHCQSPYSDQVAGMSVCDQQGAVEVWFDQEKIFERSQLK